MRKLYIVSLITCFALQISLAQNVGVGTTSPEAKLHVAGDLMVDSAMVINRIALKDSSGDTRMLFDADNGSFQMLDSNGVWYEVQVSSPPTTTKSGGDFTTTERYENGKVIVETRDENEVLLEYEERDPDAYDIGTEEFYETKRIYKNGCLKEETIATNTEKTIHIVYDCPSGDTCTVTTTYSNNATTALGVTNFVGDYVETRNVKAGATLTQGTTSGTKLGQPFLDRTDWIITGSDTPYTFRIGTEPLGAGLFGGNGEGLQIKITDDQPAILGVPDITLGIDQDDQGVAFCGSRSFQVKWDNLMDLLWELDSETGVKNTVTDPVTGEVIEVNSDPVDGTIKFGNGDANGQGGVEFIFPNASKPGLPGLRIPGKLGSGLHVVVTDTVPPVGIAQDITLELNEDNGRLTVSNIGSSGLDGVRIDLGEEGKPGMQFFGPNDQGFKLHTTDLDPNPAVPDITIGIDQDNQAVSICESKELKMKLDGIMDMLWELDAAEKDGIIRVTDESTGEVVEIGLSPGTTSAASVCNVDQWKIKKDSIMDLLWEFDSSLGEIRRTTRQGLSIHRRVINPAAEEESISYGGTLRMTTRMVTSSSMISTRFINAASTMTMRCIPTQSTLFFSTEAALVEKAEKFNDGAAEVEQTISSGPNDLKIFKRPNAQQIEMGGSSGNMTLQVNGLVNSQVIMAAVKNFQIDHPLDPDNKVLRHASIETNGMMNLYNGSVSTDADGYATVKMPVYFMALNRDFQYNLTVVGQTFAKAVVWEKMRDDGTFIIRTDEPGVEISWQVTGLRQDQFARDNPIEVEGRKTPGQIGQRLYTKK